MLCWQRSARLALAILFALVVVSPRPGSAEPKSPPGAKLLYAQPSSTFTIFVESVEVSCAPIGRGGTYLPGRFVRSRNFDGGFGFLSIKNELKALRILKKTQQGFRAQKTQTRIETLRVRQRLSNSRCALGPPTPPPTPPPPAPPPTETPDYPPPTSTPTQPGTPSATPIPQPVASDSAAAGTGIEPLAITFSVDPGIAGEAMSCEVLDVPQGLDIQVFENCTALASPQDHRLGEQSVSFQAVRLSDGARSNTASVTISWSQDGSFIGDAHSLARYRDALTPDEVQHLLSTTSLGAHAADAMNIGTAPGGLDALVERMLSPAPGGCAQTDAEALQVAQFEKYVWCTFEQDVGFLFCTPNTQDGRIQWNSEAAATYWMHHLRYGCEPLRERIGLMWHNHFSVNHFSMDGVQSPWADNAKSHVDLLRSNVAPAQGRLFLPFDYLVSQMHGADGAMLFYLNNGLNDYRRGYDENYARELLELFTLGVSDPVTGAPTYSEEHMMEIRKAVAGYYEGVRDDAEYSVCCEHWVPGDPTCQQLVAQGASCRTRLRQTVVPAFDNIRWNDPTNPQPWTLFEGTAWERVGLWKANTLAEGEDNLTQYLVREHPGVARYVATRLIATFITTQPTTEMVDKIAQELRDSDFDITNALRTILTSSSFYAASARTDTIASPIESFMGFVNRLSLPLARTPAGSWYYNLYATLRKAMGASGQTLMQPPTVFGWQEAGKISGGKIHDGIAFVTVQRWLERSNGLVRYLNDIQGSINYGLNYSWTQLLPGGEDNRNPGKVLDHLTSKLGITLSAAERTIILDYLTTVTTQTMTENGLTVAHPLFTFSIDWAAMSEPKFQELWRQKGPGLLTLLFSLPQMHVR